MSNLWLEVAKEIRENAFDAWAFDRDQGQYMGSFDTEECAKILEKRFGARVKEEAVMIPMRFKPTWGTTKGIPYPGGIVGAMQEDHNGGYIRYTDYEYVVSKLKSLLEKARDSVEDELNTVLSGLVYQRNAAEREAFLRQLLDDIEKELQG